MTMAPDFIFRANQALFWLILDQISRWKRLNTFLAYDHRITKYFYYSPIRIECRMSINTIDFKWL